MTAHEQQSTFDRWLAAYRGVLFKVVRAYADSRADQDDLFQEIAVAVWKSIPNFRAESSESTWIYRVALLTALSWLRSEKRRRNDSMETREPVLAVATPDPDPRLEWLYDEIRKLDDVDRSLTLLLFDGLSYREIADTLGLSENNVGVRIHRIKRRLTAKRAAEEPHGA